MIPNSVREMVLGRIRELEGYVAEGERQAAMHEQSAATVRARLVTIAGEIADLAAFLGAE